MPLVFASTNKVYGDLDDIDAAAAGRRLDARAIRRIARTGIGERQKLDFCTPYGCSKGGADQYVLDYARQFGVPAAVLRMSCIYGPRQLGTEDQGWVAHFLLRALAGEPITIYGDGRQVRDVLHVDDAVARLCRLRGSASGPSPGGPSTWAAGRGNAVSLLQLIDHIEDLLGRAVGVRFADWRPSDQRWFVADTQRASRAALGLPQPLDWRAGVGGLAARISPRGRMTRQRAMLGMRVALVNPHWHFEHSIYFGCREPHLPLELGYAKALLEQAGHRALLLDGHLMGLDDRAHGRCGCATSAPTWPW